MAEKEVYFGYDCPRCAHFSLPQDADPCDECLSEPVNEDSHKPIHFKEKTKTASQK